MTRELQLRQAGGSISATLPKDMAERLHLAAGDTVLAVETVRGILLTPYDPGVGEALAHRRHGVGALPQCLAGTGQVTGAAARGEPRWVDRLVVEAVQFDLVREHGGMPRPARTSTRSRRPWSHSPDGAEPTGVAPADLAELAAAYGLRPRGWASGFYDAQRARIAFVIMAVARPLLTVATSPGGEKGVG